MTSLWKASVCATHHFWTESDIQELIPAVKTRLAGIETLMMVNDNHTPIALTCIETGQIEMLLVLPDHFRKGIGKDLAELGISNMMYGM